MAGQPIDNEHRMVSWSPFSALKEAVKAVPAMKYAVAVLGLVAVVAIAAAWRVNFKVAVFGAGIILILMVSVLVFARLTAFGAGLFLLPAMILLYTFVILTAAAGVRLFTAAAFKWPPDLHELIFRPVPVTPTPTSISISTPTPTLISTPGSRRTWSIRRRKRTRAASRCVLEQSRTRYTIWMTKAMVIQLALKQQCSEPSATQFACSR